MQKVYELENKQDDEESKEKLRKYLAAEYKERNKPLFRYKKQTSIKVFRKKPLPWPETDAEVLRYTSSRAVYVPTVWTYIDKKIRLRGRHRKNLKRIPV